ncbi:FACT complex subunit SSRP1 isoform X2 [Cryptomeria japonica]|uniref:FACT complex subunit SSRP1 isoform X2 n=1 Tax=Cryptomeria japonica TaxID=3369 RepID=UPI0027DA60DB|nr:FACT complex subunit SSRP1 isoform X2 [Cryptomeria japonica]
MADGHQFNNILLGGRGGMNPGQLRIHSGGIIWRKQGGGKVVEVGKPDIVSLSWTRIPKGYQLAVKSKAGLNVKFNGFREQDVSNLTSYMTNTMGVTPEEKHLSISGRNWGEVNLEGNMLTFLVGSRQAFELSLADVSQTQLQGKNEVVLEFHVDDTTGANEVFREKIMSMADVGPSGAEAVALFEDIAILTPRGRYTVELHISFLRLQGQANDFKIQFSSVIRLFMLPKSPHTLVVITLDPPIRKGQTFYPHIVLQFAMEEIAECALSMNEELLNTKYKDKLEPSYKGLSHEVFTQILRGLSGAKVTRPGKFRSSQDGYAVRASLKAEDGILYPLEKSFFFLPKPPTLVLHDEIEYLEFERHGAAGTSSMSSHYFDLHIRLKSEQEHQFRNIQRNEYHNLFNFINSKGLKIMNLGDGQGTGGVASVLENSDDEAVDPHLERIKNAIDAGGGEESDEEDEDFVAEKDDAGSPTEGSEEEESDASESAENKERVAKKEVKKKEATAPKVTATKRKKKDEEEDGGKKRKQKKKKDPNAPKRAMSGFMFFSQIERENIKKNNPGMPFTEVAKALGERWKKMSVEEKEPFESKARADQKRYKNAMADYKSGPTNNIDSGNESDSE